MKKIIKNYLYTSAYQIFILLLPVITLPYVSRVLMPAGIGANSWVSAINSYFVLFAVLGLTTYGQREIALCRDDLAKMRRTFWQLELASVVTSLITLIGYFFFIVIVNQHILLLFIYSMSIIACIFDISWFFSGLENFRLLMMRNFIIKSCSIILILTCVKSPADIWIYVLIQSGSVLVSNISLWPVALKIIGKPILQDLKGVLNRVHHSVRFFIPQASINVYVTLNKVLLGFISTKTQTGYFDSSDKLLRMLFSLFLAASTVILPRMANLFAHHDFKRIKKFVTGMIGLSLWAILLAIYLIFTNAALIVRIVLGSQYLSMIPVLQTAVFMLLPMALSNVLANQYLVPLDRIRVYTQSVIYGAVFNLVIEIPLIMFKQAIGAALASVLSEIVVTSIQILYCKNDFEFLEYLKSCSTMLFASGLMILEGIIVTNFINNIFVVLGISIITVAIYCMVTVRWLNSTFKRMA
ncbi:oligosaccharide flippase family protein [Lactiplantibacillus plantarum]|uniref:oligosaccharide flippase family protein n=1 Tax=Lactiplantibacillus plantarum TaxID=1590 RepID=UPI00345F109F